MREIITQKLTELSAQKEHGAHIDLYAMAALNWRATQELLERIERLKKNNKLF